MSLAATLTFSTGIVPIDEALPWRGLAAGRLHEVVTAKSDGPAVGFLAYLLSKTQKPILWCSQKINLYPPGLAHFGLAASNVVFVHTNSNKEALWSLEEGLRSSAFGAIVGEVEPFGLAAGHRLQLIAKKNNTTGFLLMNRVAQSHHSIVTRWHISPLVSLPTYRFWHRPVIGAPRLSIELQRCRGGRAPQNWSVEWNESTLSFNLVPPIAERFAQTVPIRQAIYANHSY